MGNYLYNGVELPDIYSVYTPEVQTERPNAVIFNDYGVWYLMCMDTTLYREPYDDGSAEGRLRYAESTKARTYKFNPNGADSGWVLAVDHSQAQDSVAVVPASWTKWSNFDIYNKDGTLYLAASDPVPVSPVNPAALMQGFATMLSLRRNRS